MNSFHLYDVLRDAGHEIAALDFDLLFGVHRIGGGDLDLDLFSGGLADQHIVFAFYVRHDGFVHLVAADAHRAGIQAPMIVIRFLSCDKQKRNALLKSFVSCSVSL